jgi:hypothetical protein
VHYDEEKPQNCVVEKFCTTGDQSLLSLPSTVEKNFSFHFKHYNLTIRAVKVCYPYRAQWKKKFLSTSNVIISQSMRSNVAQYIGQNIGIFVFSSY